MLNLIRSHLVIIDIIIVRCIIHQTVHTAVTLCALIPGSLVLQSTVGYQLAFLWHRAVNTLFGKSSHQNINVDPSSVELYTKLIELLFALLSIGLPQLAIELINCVNQVQLVKTELINYHLYTSHFPGLDPILHSPCMLMCWIPPVPVQGDNQR